MMKGGLWKDVGVVGEEVVRFREEVQMGVQEGVARGPAQGFRRTLGSHTKYFKLFVKAVGADEGALGEPCVLQDLPTVQGWEEELLVQFLWYVARYLRAVGKKKKGVATPWSNSGSGIVGAGGGGATRGKAGRDGRQCLEEVG